jgi:lactate dehydrogenase-like 2-hydroxyacid dehydrogenase
VQTPFKIAVTRMLPEPALAVLSAAGCVSIPPHGRLLERHELLSAVRDADAVVCLLQDQIDREVLQAAGTRLAIVANVAVGYDNVDVAACAERGVVVTNTPGVLVAATADLAMALILAVTRRLGEAERLVRTGLPWSWELSFMLGSGIQGRTLGIVGFGGIGRATARRARAFDMSIVYAGPRRANSTIEQELDARYLTLDELLATADVISLHCPLLPETRHLIDAAALGRMKPDAFLINTARGPIIDEPALVAALQSGSIAGAGLDVFEHEPEVHPALLELENVVVVPHIGSATVETRTAMAVLAAENVAAVLRGDAPLTPVRVPGSRG